MSCLSKGLMGKDVLAGVFAKISIGVLEDVLGGAFAKVSMGVLEDVLAGKLEDVLVGTWGGKVLIFSVSSFLILFKNSSKVIFNFFIRIEKARKYNRVQICPFEYVKRFPKAKIILHVDNFF